MSMIARLSIGLSALLLALLAPTTAKADCMASSASASLGNPSSFAVASTAQGVSTSSGFTCAGSGVVTLITTNTVTATALATHSDGTLARLHDAATGDYIPFVICRDSSCAETYPLGSQITWSSTTLLGLLNLFSGPGGTLPIYIRTVPGSHVAAGTYTGTVTLSWNWNICTIGALFLCLTRDTGTATSTIAVSLVVERDCAVSAPAVNFGSAALIESFDPVTRTLTVRCSKGTSYTVGISDGLHGLNGIRRLAGGGNFMAYDLFFPASSGARWGSVGAERRGSGQATANPGTLDGVTNQTYTYRAEIIAGQATPPPGTYTDTLTVDIQF
jgi:spore coat protein U-like protein